MTAAIGGLGRDGPAPAEPKATGASPWTVLSLLVDAFTVAVSVVDVVTDVLVMREFSRLGHAVFFQASAAIFVLAQLSYAFLFAATFAGGHSPIGRCTVFLLVLPFAQLVPLFTWIHAFHFPSVDRLLLRYGLSDGVADQASAARGAEAGDSLWSFLQSKYQSHAGFLVEAFVEAVPQAVLQTVFVVAAHDGTALNAVSVSMSVFTVASKGYLVSFALDYPTFFFNFGCIVADCLGMFAIVTTLAVSVQPGHLGAGIMFLSASGLLLSVLAGHALLWFTILDDHLKLRDRLAWPSGVRGVQSTAFDLYVVRVAAWFLAIVPCAVLFTGARLALLPAFALRSIDPDLVRHARFYQGLHSFLTGRGGGSPDRQARLWTVNTFLALARRHVRNLEAILHVTERGRQSAAVLHWARNVGTPRELPGVFIPSAPAWRRANQEVANTAAGEDAALQQAILDSFRSLGTQQPAGFVGVATAAFRRLRAVAWVQRQASAARHELQARSEVFRPGFVQRCRQDRSLLSLALRGTAFFSISLAFLCAIPLLFGHALLILASVIFPFLHLASSCTAMGDQDVGGAGACAPSSANETCPALQPPGPSAAGVRAALPCGLTLAYCASLLCMLALAPTVARRQLLWLDLLDLRDFPEAFYGGAVLVEIRRRHLRSSLLQRRLGHFLSQHVLGFLEEA